jgi:hypothetical protein
MQDSREFIDESATTEITILPDGRVYAFGLSREVAEILHSLCPENHPLLESLAQSEQKVHHDTTPHNS